ncbi:MAG: hypothetical protein NC548_40375 [Lachnospiraceae bacterium]|nr:hypothetical protein [Lachnospiraceae bacterium]
MDTKDLELKLCSSDPIYVGDVPIFPMPISRIAQIGYTKFNAELKLLCLTADDVKALTGDDISDIGVYTYFVANALRDAELMKVLIFWLSEITHCKVVFSQRKMCFVTRAFEINKDNFSAVQTAIRQRNGLQNIEEEEDNPANEAARRVLQRRKEERLKRRKAKALDDDESAITLSDLVSILASGLGMTLQEVMGYDLYQFNDQFNRLKIMDDYEVSVQALLHGAKKEDINFTHWITKIKHNPED